MVPPKSLTPVMVMGSRASPAIRARLDPTIHGSCAKDPRKLKFDKKGVVDRVYRSPPGLWPGTTRTFEVAPNEVLYPGRPGYEYPTTSPFRRESLWGMWA